MKTIILYFSGTGNSLVCAKNIQRHFKESSLIRIHSKTQSQIICDNLFIIVPTYAYGVPAVVYKYLENANIKANYIAVIATYGTSTKGLFRQVYNLFDRKKIKLNYYGGIRTVENFLPLFSSVEKEKIDELLQLQENETKQIINDLKNKITKTKPKSYRLSRIVSKVYRTLRPVVNLTIKVNEDICVGCGICSKVCSNEAITIDKETKKAQIAVKKCQTCQACLNYCPYLAISQLRFKETTPRYHHPQVKAQDINNYPLNK